MRSVCLYMCQVKEMKFYETHSAMRKRLFVVQRGQRQKEHEGGGGKGEDLVIPELCGGGRKVSRSLQIRRFLEV